MLSCSKARLQLTQGHPSPFFSRFSYLFNHGWRDGEDVAVFNESSAPFLLLSCLQYTCCLLFFGVFLYNGDTPTTAVHPSAWGDPSWPKESSSLAPQVSSATILTKRQAEPSPLPSATPSLLAAPALLVALLGSFAGFKTKSPATPLKLHPHIVGRA